MRDQDALAPSEHRRLYAGPDRVPWRCALAVGDPWAPPRQCAHLATARSADGLITYYHHRGTPSRSLTALELRQLRAGCV